MTRYIIYLRTSALCLYLIIKNLNLYLPCKIFYYVLQHSLAVKCVHRYKASDGSHLNSAWSQMSIDELWGTGTEKYSQYQAK